MAMNHFKIYVQDNGNTTHLGLRGDLDQLAAAEFIRVLLLSLHASRRVIVHTADLQIVHPSGADFVRQGLNSGQVRLESLFFTGHNAQLLALSRTRILKG